MYLVNGDIFQATCTISSNLYRFGGISLDDPTGCGYIILENLTEKTETHVEYWWFKERKIIKAEKGDIVKKKEKGKILKGTIVEISENDEVCVRKGSSLETWSWSSIININKN